MKILLTIAALFSAVNAMACYCETPSDFKTTDDLKSYDFIALIKSLASHASVGGFGCVNGDIKMNVIELFKGAPSTIAVDPMFNSSCGMTLNEGEQWLFFGNIRIGKLEVGSCTYSTRYRDTTGKREWWGMREIRALAILRTIYGKTTVTGAKNKVFYTN